MSLIDPVLLPTAGALNYARGDVRHLSRDDEQSYAAISAATRHLAYRDLVLQERLNDTIAALNNREQVVNIPSIRTLIPPTTTEPVTNFRIPAGFEARVLNASIAATPTSQCRLIIGWNSTFGGSSYTTGLVDTFSEASAGTEFFSTGELVMILQNSTAQTLEVVASIVVAIRPVGIQAGGLIGPGAVGPQGPSGPVGSTGATGSIGPAGPAGTAGAVWRGLWSVVTGYLRNDVVRFDAGNGYSSFIALVNNTGVSPPLAPTESNGTWELMSESGVGDTGPIGLQGPVGINVVGSWWSGGSYRDDDLVTLPTVTPSGTVHRSFVALVDVPISDSPIGPSSGSQWLEIFGPTTGLSVEENSVSGHYTTTSGDFTWGSTEGLYLGNPDFAEGALLVFNFNESVILSTSPDTSPGLAMLRRQAHLIFCGTLFIQFPTLADSAALNWTPAEVNISASAHGQVVVDSGTLANNVQVRIDGVSLGTSTGYYIVVDHTTPAMVELNFNGMTTL